MMRVPLCSNVGLGSSVLRAHTKRSGCLSPQPSAGPTHPCPPRQAAKISSAVRVSQKDACRFLQPLARPLYVLRVVLEQDPVNAEVLLHPCGHQGLQLRVPAALVRFLNEPRNTRRSNPVRVPVIWSAYFSIDYCMGVLLGRWNWSFNDTITQRGTPLPAHHPFAAKPRCATYAIRSLAKSHSTTRRSCAERLIMCAQAAAW